MKKYPYFNCMLPIKSCLNLIELAEKLSNMLFGGVPFVGLEEYIYDEVPAVYTSQSILGLEAILQGSGGDKGYILEVHSHPGVTTPEHTDEVGIDITKYVSHLIEEDEDIQIIHAEIRTQNYIKGITE